MARQQKIDIEKITEGAECVGNVYSYGTYGIDTIRITLKEGIKLPRGDYVFVKDDKGRPIVYQVSYPHWYKPSFDFEESLIVAGGPEKDEHRRRYRCIGILVGKLDENGEIYPPMIPIPPLTDVLKCPPELVKLVTEPLDEWKISIGVNPETGRPVYMALEPLIRQSLLVTGAQGTGKTTAVLTLISRAVEASPSVRFLVFDWTGEYISLKEKLENKVQIVFWEDFVTNYVYQKPEVLMALFEGDPRVSPGDAVHKALARALFECKTQKIIPTKEILKQEIKNQMDQKKIWESTAITAVSVIDDNVLDKYPEKRERSITNLVSKYNVVIVDFSRCERMPDDFTLKRRTAGYMAEEIWNKAVNDRSFGCVVFSDEAHRVCPQEGYFEKIWFKLATEGGRNCCPFWLVARRLSLVSKNVTVESQQNIVCFNVEDIDRKRIMEDIGTTFAGMLGTLAQGEAMVKSAMAFRVPGQTIHVKFDEVIKPASAAYRAKERFQKMASS
ncbi:MAG: ATP-binding protein [Candidatus Bathyarchaeia archaeon]